MFTLSSNLCQCHTIAMVAMLKRKLHVHDTGVPKAIQLYCFCLKYALRGPGGGLFDLAKVEMDFSVVSDREQCQLPGAFYRIKKYCSSSRSYKILKSGKYG